MFNLLITTVIHVTIFYSLSEFCCSVVFVAIINKENKVYPLYFHNQMTLLISAAHQICEMEVARSSASPTAPRHNCSSFHDSDDVSDDVDVEPRGSPLAAAATASCHGDTTPPSSPSQDVKPRLYHYHHHHHHQTYHHGDALSPHLAVSKLQPPVPPRSRCPLDVASIVANDNRMTFFDNR